MNKRDIKDSSKRTNYLGLDNFDDDRNGSRVDVKCFKKLLDECQNLNARTQTMIGGETPAK